MYYNVPTVIANAGFTENISNIIPTFEEPIVIATWALVFITTFYATITFYMLLIMKRDRERKVIVEIVKKILIPTINTLKEDRKQFKKINISSFPEFLGLQFGIPNRLLKGAIFDRFAKRKPLLKRQILKYNELCSKIHEKIKGNCSISSGIKFYFAAKFRRFYIGVHSDAHLWDSLYPKR